MTVFWRKWKAQRLNILQKHGPYLRVIYFLSREYSENYGPDNYDIKIKYHRPPTLPVYPNSVQHFRRPQLCSDQRYIH